MTATYDFVVDGRTFLEIETKAMEKAAQFFGERSFRLEDYDIRTPMVFLVHGTEPKFFVAHVTAVVEDH